MWVTVAFNGGEGNGTGPHEQHVAIVIIWLNFRGATFQTAVKRPLKDKSTRKTCWEITYCESST